MTRADDALLQQLGNPTGPAPAGPTPELPEGISLPYSLHCSATDGSVMIFDQVVAYGGECEITENTLRQWGAAAVRVIELTEDPREQRRMFGGVRLRRGPWPEGVSRILPGSRRWLMDRDGAYSRADRVADEHARDRALEDARLRFGARSGPPPPHEPAYGMPGWDPEQ
jgi:hypothetical protein